MALRGRGTVRTRQCRVLSIGLLLGWSPSHSILYYLCSTLKCQGLALEWLGETLGAMLLSWANVHFYQELMARAREAISRGEFAAYAEDVRRRYSNTEANDDDAS